MDIQSVLIELDLGSKVNTTCGTLISNNFIITTSSILSECRELDKIHYTDELLCKLNQSYTFTVIAENLNKTVHKQAKLAAVFQSRPINTAIGKYLTNWRTSEEVPIIKSRMSTFLLLTFAEESMEVLREVLCGLYGGLSGLDWGLADRVCAKSAPFGNRHFLNSYSEGVIANVTGVDRALFWTDCPTVFGSDGSPVFLLKGKQHNLIGLVLSSLNWINGEWLGLTLCSPLRSILHSFSSPTVVTDSMLPIMDHTKSQFNILDSVSNGMVMVKNGPNWGTAILLDGAKGIFITNAHVVENPYNVELFWKGNKLDAEIIFEAVTDNNYDVAILKSNPIALQHFDMRVMKIRTENIRIGDAVYAAGYSLYPPELQPNITITSGHVSKVSKTMLMTTCSVLSGSSGGAILTPDGHLIGIITSNTVLTSDRAGFPRNNMCIPMYSIWRVLRQFLESHDPDILNRLTYPDAASNIWTTLKHKL